MAGVQWRFSKIAIFTIWRGRRVFRRFGFRIERIEEIQFAVANYEINGFSSIF
jgi:hypothetical protein